MPRKGLSNFEDYDDGFDDYDYDIDEHEEAADINIEIAQQGLWRCSICTCDNDESMFVCDIGGVLCNPVVGNQSINKNTVEGRCKESKLAKSLFGSVPSNTPKGMSFSGISRGNIHHLHKAFSSKNSCVSICC